MLVDGDIVRAPVVAISATDPLVAEIVVCPAVSGPPELIVTLVALIVPVPATDRLPLLETCTAPVFVILPLLVRVPILTVMLSDCAFDANMKFAPTTVLPVPYVFVVVIVIVPAPPVFRFNTAVPTAEPPSELEN